MKVHSLEVQNNTLVLDTSLCLKSSRPSRTKLSMDYIHSRDPRDKTKFRHICKILIFKELNFNCYHVAACNKFFFVAIT